MDKKSFFEHPLDTNFYKVKKFVNQSKRPLRVLVTEAGSKTAYNLIYKICNGSVFGPDQEIILHLINAKGTLHHKTIFLELDLCGFPCFKDYVMSSNPAVAFKDVEIVISITNFQEISGFIISGAIVNQTSKIFEMVKNIQDYASKECKVIFTGPATKSMTIMLSTLHQFFPTLNIKNISCVTHLDAVISKAVLAAKLKTTTDRIKNVIIWSVTYPDIRCATVNMYPLDDRNPIERKDVPITDVLQDEEWLYTKFGLAIYRRIMDKDLIKFGKAIAMSTIHHLKVLLEGTDKFEEIPSMGVITPSTGSYGLPKGIGLSFPVKTENGNWEILQNIPTSVATQLNIMKTIFQSDEEKVRDALNKILTHTNYSELTKLKFAYNLPNEICKNLAEIKKWSTKYYVIPNPAEIGTKPHTVKNSSRKSVVWSEIVSLKKNLPASNKTSIIFDTGVPEDALGNFRSNSVNFSNETENLGSDLHKNHPVKENIKKKNF